MRLGVVTALCALLLIGNNSVEPALAQGPSPALDAAISIAGRLPQTPGSRVLAAEVGQEGHWTFANRARETITAAGAEELQRALSVLAPAAAGANDRLVLMVTRNAALTQSARFRDLPERAELWIAAAPEGYPLLRQVDGSKIRLFAQVRPAVIIELTEAATFEAALWHLSKPFDVQRLRVLSLEPGGPQTLPRIPSARAAERPGVEPIDPYKLAAALSTLRRQSVVLSARLEGELLHFQPASGPELSILWKDVTQAAEAADINLLALASETPRQPGNRNWFWQRIEIPGIDRMTADAPLGDFLQQVAGARGTLVVVAERSTADRDVLRIRPGRMPGSQSAMGGVSETLSDLVANVTGRISPIAIVANLRSANRERELGRRLFPGIPSWVQFTYLAGLLLGLLGLSPARRWWLLIWPAEQRADYGGAMGYGAARLARLVVFSTTFLPAAGLPAALAALTGRLAGKS